MKLKSCVTSIVAAVGLASATPAFAVTNFFTNFDSVAVAAGGFVIVPTVEGWTATTGAGIELQNNAAGSPFSAPNLVELDSTNNTTMSRLIDAGAYTLSYYYSPRPNQPTSTNGIELLLDNVVIGSVAGMGAGDTVWKQYVAAFTTTKGAMLSFRAVGTDDSLGGYLDDINLVGAAVPEASTWAMMLFGFGVVGAALRRRRLVSAFA